jgi:PKHD-type hydroxylase
MNYSWKAFKSIYKKKLMQGPFKLKDMNGTLQPPTNDGVAYPQIVPGFLSPAECDQIIELSKSLQASESKITSEGRDSDYRKSDVCWIFPYPETSWVFDHIERAIKNANKTFKFVLFGFFQGAQIASYDKGGHYNWHSDLGPDRSSHRKLSISILLNKPEDYTGGELEFMGLKGDVPREQGTAIIFPSFLIHRVAPIKSGTRHSLVAWISGPPFR